MKMKSLIAALLMAGTLVMGQAKPKSKAEAEAVNAIITATTPDQRIAAAENLLSKYKDTAFKSLALQMEAEAYGQKGRRPQRDRIWRSRDRSRPQKLPGVAAGIQPARAHDQGIRSGQRRKTEARHQTGERRHRRHRRGREAQPAAHRRSVGRHQEGPDFRSSRNPGYDRHCRQEVGPPPSPNIRPLSTARRSPAYTAMVRLMSVYNNDKKYDEATALADKLIAAPAPDNLKKIARRRKSARRQRERSIAFASTRRQPRTPERT